VKNYSNKCLYNFTLLDQENVYIEELAELISVSMADMNSLSVKPDKCAILQETVNQIRKIREQEEDGRSSSSSSSSRSSSRSGGGSSSGDRDRRHCSSLTTTDDTGLALQLGDVSSSKPAMLDTQVLGTFLLEALDGFLFVVNTEGKTEYVSDNVAHFLHYRPQDLVGKSIYNIIHHGDHARFSSSLLPTTIGLLFFFLIHRCFVTLNIKKNMYDKIHIEFDFMYDCQVGRAKWRD
jgi:nuclear receptor coactivator 2